MTYQFLGNTNNLIDWDNFIEDIKKQNGYPNCLARSNEDFDEKMPYHMLLKSANINWNNVKWTDYNLEIENQIVKIFSGVVKSKMLRCFVSKVDPGVCVPTHWDEGDIELIKHSDKNRISRYICFIQDPQPGHVFVVENECFYDVTKGSIFKWGKHTDFHSTANTGFSSHYIFHFLGEDYL